MSVWLATFSQALHVLFLQQLAVCFAMREMLTADVVMALHAQSLSMTKGISNTGELVFLLAASAARVQQEACCRKTLNLVGCAMHSHRQNGFGETAETCACCTH